MNAILFSLSIKFYKFGVYIGILIYHLLPVSLYIVLMIYLKKNFRVNHSSSNQVLLAICFLERHEKDMQSDMQSLFQSDHQSTYVEKAVKHFGYMLALARDTSEKQYEEGVVPLIGFLECV